MPIFFSYSIVIIILLGLVPCIQCGINNYLETDLYLFGEYKTAMGIFIDLFFHVDTVPEVPGGLFLLLLRGPGGIRHQTLSS